MKIVIDGTPEEISALISGLQGSKDLGFDEDSFNAAVKRHLEKGDLSTKGYIPIPRKSRTVKAFPD